MSFRAVLGDGEQVVEAPLQMHVRDDTAKVEMPHKPDASCGTASSHRGIASLLSLLAISLLASLFAQQARIPEEAKKSPAEIVEEDVCKF